MIHGLISLLYNGLLQGAAGAPLQRPPARLDLSPPASPSARLLLPKIKKSLPYHEKRLSETHTHKRTRLDSISPDKVSEGV